MDRIPVTDLLQTLAFDYQPHIDELIRIGDKTAIREKDGVSYRRNYERGLMIAALANRFGLTDFLEFGTGRGFACACLLRFAQMQRLTTIDIANTELARSLIKELDINDDSVEYVTANANKMADDAIAGPFDLVFIDAQHDAKSVKLNYNYVRNKLKPKSVIIFDDYRKKFPSVIKMIDKIPFTHKVLVHTDGWIVENVAINDTGDCDRVIDNKEHGSGMVVCSNDIPIL